jgi:hypothetical protein
MLIMKIGPLPDAMKPRDPRRWNALEPGFHGVPVDAVHTDRDADGAGVT